MPESHPPIELNGLALGEIQALIDARRLPPVAQWDPPFCGHSEMRIARDGRWYHQGSPIDRPAMVRLFSTVLRREADGRHMLVTPVEKLEIDVESTAFRAVEMAVHGQGETRAIALTLNSGDALVVGPGHPLSMATDDHGPRPRVQVRHGLEAELSRPVYYELAELALADGHNPPGVWSGGKFFTLGGPR